MGRASGSGVLAQLRQSSNAAQHPPQSRLPPPLLLLLFLIWFFSSLYFFLAAHPPSTTQRETERAGGGMAALTTCFQAVSSFVFLRRVCVFPLICLISISFRCHLWHNDHERQRDAAAAVAAAEDVTVNTCCHIRQARDARLQSALHSLSFLMSSAAKLLPACARDSRKLAKYLSAGVKTDTTTTTRITRAISWPRSHISFHYPINIISFHQSINNSKQAQAQAQAATQPQRMHKSNSEYTCCAPRIENEAEQM